MAIISGTKRNAQGASASRVNAQELKAAHQPDASRKSKKPKVEKIFDPTEEPMNELINALNGPLGDELTCEVVSMTKNIVNDALKTLAEDRSNLLTAYVSLAGECLSTATVALRDKAAAAATELEDVQGVNDTYIAAVETAKKELTVCEDASLQAKAALVQIWTANKQTASELNTQNKELANLETAKGKHLMVAADLASSLALVMSPEATADDSEKVCVSLRSIGAPSSMLEGVGPALGQWNSEGFEAMILQQIAKAISAKATDVSNVLADWDNHCAILNAEAQRLDTVLKANNAAMRELNAGIVTMMASQKDLDLALKEAVATHQQQQQVVNEKTKAKQEADGVVSDAEAAGRAFLFLQTRTVVMPEEPVVVPEAGIEEPTVVPVNDATPVEEPTNIFAEQIATSPVDDATPVKVDDATPVKEPTNFVAVQIATSLVNDATPVKVPVDDATPVKEPTDIVAPEQITPSPVKAPAAIKVSTPVKVLTAVVAPEHRMATVPAAD